MSSSGASGRARALLILALWSVAAPALAHAASPADPVTARVTARALFEEARKLAAAGNYAAACPMFEESYRVVPGIGTLYHLADCWEHIGRTASAWARFLDVANQASAKGQTRREELARSRAAALEPRLSRLRVEFAPGVAGLVVRRDGIPVGDAQNGIAVPVDPGPHVIEAELPGAPGWKRTIMVPHDGSTVTERVPAEVATFAVAGQPLTAQLRPAAHRPAVTTAQPPSADLPPTMVARMPGPDAPQGGLAAARIAGIALVAAGVASVAVGSYYGFKVQSHTRTADSLCRGGPRGLACQNDMEKADYENAYANAGRARNVSIATLTAGGAAIIGGGLLAWWSHRELTGRRSGLASGLADVSARAGADGVRIGFGRRF